MDPTGTDRPKMAAFIHLGYRGVDVLAMSEIERPKPGRNEVVVRVHAASVDPSVRYMREPRQLGLMFGHRQGAAHVWGRDFAGRIAAVGAKVTTVAVGDEVYGTCRGAFAEYAVTRPDRIARKPATLTYEQSATVPTEGTAALLAVRDSGQVRHGHSVLVVGADGPVGRFAVQIATAFGAEVTEVGDEPRSDDVEVGSRHDVVIDAAGNRTLTQLRRLLHERGTLVVVGGESRGTRLGRLHRIWAARLLSPFVKQRLGGLLASPDAQHLHALSELIHANAVTPVLDRTFQLHETSEALKYVHDGHARGAVAIRI